MLLFVTLCRFIRHWYRGAHNSCSRTDLIFSPIDGTSLADKRASAANRIREEEQRREKERKEQEEEEQRRKEEVERKEKADKEESEKAAVRFKGLSFDLLGTKQRT